MTNRNDDRKERFIQKLAAYMVKDQASRSIQLEMKKPEAIIWQDLRSATPLFGYPTHEEAVEILREFLK